MNNLKKYGSLFFFILSCFILGMYTMAVKYNIKPVEPQQWFLTSIFGFFFLMRFISYIKKD